MLLSVSSANGEWCHMAAKLDIFSVLGKIQARNRSYYDDLVAAEQAAIQPIVLQRWLAGNKHPLNVMAVNACVNKYVFALHKHPHLLWRLMCAASPKGVGRPSWLAGKKKNNTSLAVKAIREVYNYSAKQALEVLPLLSTDQVLDYAEQAGWQKDEIDKLKKQLNGSKANK